MSSLISTSYSINKKYYPMIKAQLTEVLLHGKIVLILIEVMVDILLSDKAIMLIMGATLHYQ